MNHRTTLAIALGLLAAACSRQPAVEPEANTQAPAAAATEAEALNADDDTLEVAPPVINEGEEHDESKPHTH